jgi:hypothetical protein
MRIIPLHPQSGLDNLMQGHLVQDIKLYRGWVRSLVQPDEWGLFHVVLSESPQLLELSCVRWNVLVGDSEDSLG